MQKRKPTGTPIKRKVISSKKTTLPITTEKLQKVLANAGLGSRREIETWITAGRVSVDGELAKLGDRVKPMVKIRVDGRLVDLNATSKKLRVLLYHKPAREICSRKDPEGRPTVFDTLPKIRHGRWIMVGRLDFNTSGVLLFTTDGELAKRLMHPSYEIEREYAVRVLGEVPKETLKQLQEGVALEDGLAKFDLITDAGGQGVNHWYHVVLREGKNREVRRLWESQGVQVSRLIRIRYGCITLPRLLRPGRWNELETSEISKIQRLVHKG
jgi:23S rRNA pseudouridine2605 synthase